MMKSFRNHGQTELADHDVQEQSIPARLVVGLHPKPNTTYSDVSNGNRFRQRYGLMETAYGRVPQEMTKTGVGYGTTNTKTGKAELRAQFRPIRQAPTAKTLSSHTQAADAPEDKLQRFKGRLFLVTTYQV